jgi:hypothetical protein
MGFYTKLRVYIGYSRLYTHYGGPQITPKLPLNTKMKRFFDFYEKLEIFEKRKFLQKSQKSEIFTQK